MSTLIPHDLQEAIYEYERFTGDRVTVAFDNKLHSIECCITHVNTRDGKFSYYLTQPGKTKKTGRKKTSRLFTKSELIELLKTMSSFE